MQQHSMDKMQAMQKLVSGVNCAQAVFCEWAEDLGLDEETAGLIASGFGGGMSRGDTCGAVTGALMVLGLACGDDDDAMHEKKKALQDGFIAGCGALNCRDLTGFDFSIPGEREKAVAAGKNQDICPKCICRANELLNELLEDVD